MRVRFGVGLCCSSDYKLIVHGELFAFVATTPLHYTGVMWFLSNVAERLRHIHTVDVIKCRKFLGRCDVCDLVKKYVLYEFMQCM